MKIIDFFYKKSRIFYENQIFIKKRRKNYVDG